MTIADTVVGAVRANLASVVFVAACRIGFDSVAASGDGAIDDSGTVDQVTGDAVVAPNLVFVTSMGIDLCAGGVAAADQACRNEAQAASRTGAFVSWTSDGTSDARDRLAGASGWVRADGRPFAATVDTMLTNGPWYPPIVDAMGVDQSLAFVSSATDTAGRLSTYTTPCMIGGRASLTGTSWYTGNLIATGNRVICLGTDRQATVAAAVVTGRFAFVTAGPFDPSTGIGAADAQCAAEASAATLPGTYKAFMTTSIASAVTRFNLSGPPWVRTDGVQLMTTATDLSTWNMFTAVDHHADGTRASGYAWTGHRVVTGTAPTCNDWTTKSSGVSGTMHEISESRDSWTSVPNGCATSGALICLQE